MSKKNALARFTPEHPDPLPPSVRAYVDGLPEPTKGTRRLCYLDARHQNEAGYAEACAYHRLGIHDWPDLRPALCNLTLEEGERIQHRVNALLAECRPDIPRADWRIVCRCGFPFTVAEQDRPRPAFHPETDGIIDARVYACPHCDQHWQVHLQPNGEMLACLCGPLVEDAVTKALQRPVPSPAYGLPVESGQEGDAL